LRQDSSFALPAFVRSWPSTEKPGESRALRHPDWALLLCSCRRRPRCGLGIDIALGNCGQLLVSRFFLSKRLFKESRNIIAGKLIGPGDERSITGDLVMFDGLRGSNQRGIEHP